MFPAYKNEAYKKKNSRNRRISFEHNIDVITVDSHSEYTPEERSAAWYTSTECRVFKVQYTRESLESTATRKMDFARNQRIDAVRDLLLKAQDVQRKQSFRNYTTSNNVGNRIVNANKAAMGKMSSAKWGSFSRWLADFYKHHSEACGIAARARGMENMSAANESWCVQHQRKLHRSSAGDAAIGQLTQTLSRKFSITMGSRSYEDLTTLANDEETTSSRNASWKQEERWSAHGPSFSPKKKRSTFSALSKDLPLKPLRHVSTPPVLCNCDGPSYNSKKRNVGGDLPLKPLRHVSTPPNLQDCTGPSYNSKSGNEGGDLPLKPKRQVTPPDGDCPTCNAKAKIDREDSPPVPLRQVRRQTTPPARAA